MSELMPRDVGRVNARDSLVSWRVARETQRALDAVQSRSMVVQAQIKAAADEATAVVQARNAVTSVAAHHDAILGGILNALPIYDASDADFRAQLKQATRARVIADLLRFEP